MTAPDALQAAVQRGLAYALEPRLAPHYERHLVEECHYRTHEIMARELAALVSPVGLFVDVGAGSGLVGKALVARGLELDLVAIDISPAMLDLIDAPAYVAKHVADGSAMPLGDASFDGALAAGLLEHIVDPSALFREVARVVKPRGIFLFSFAPNQDGQTQLFDAEQGLVSHDAQRIEESLAAAGMRTDNDIDYAAYVNGSQGPALQRLVIAHRQLGAAHAID